MSPSPLPLTILYPAPSPHSIDLFNALAKCEDIDIEAIFCMERFAEREGWPSPEIEFDHDFLPVRRLSQSREFAIWNQGLLQKVKQASREGRILLVGGGYSIPSVARAMYWLNHQRFPWFFFSEKPGMSGSGLRARIRNRVIRGCLSNVTGILAHSPLAAEAYKELGFDHDRIHMVPYAMDVDEFRSIKRTLAGQPDTPFRLLYLGRLLEVKGIDWALEALLKMDLNPQQFRLTIAGGGPLDSRLKSMLNETQRHIRVDLVGETDWDKRAELMREHDALLFPSRHDGWGMAVMEALAAGLPVLGSTAAGAVAAYVQPGESGMTYAPEDERALAEAIHFCVDHPEKVAKMGNCAREAVRDWTPENTARDLIKIIRMSARNSS